MCNHFIALNPLYNGRRLRNDLKASRMWEKKLEEEAFVGFPKSNEIDIQLNPESSGFTKIISSLQSLLAACDPDVTYEMNLEKPELLFYGISEEFLRLITEKDFLPQLEKYCKKSKISYKLLILKSIRS